MLMNVCVCVCVCHRMPGHTCLLVKIHNEQNCKNCMVKIEQLDLRGKNIQKLCDEKLWCVVVRKRPLYVKQCGAHANLQFK